MESGLWVPCRPVSLTLVESSLYTQLSYLAELIEATKKDKGTAPTKDETQGTDAQKTKREWDTKTSGFVVGTGSALDAQNTQQLQWPEGRRGVQK